MRGRWLFSNPVTNLNLVTKCFPYKKVTIHCGLAFVNNIESSNLIAGCFLVGVGFLGHGGPGSVVLNDSVS